MKRYAVGADVGGSHISCALFDLHEMKLVNGVRAELDVNNKDEASVIIDGWSSALREVIEKIDESDFEGVTFAMPGPFNYADGIAMFNEQVNKFEKLYGVNIGEEIRKRLKLSDDKPIRFINDAVAFAMGESWIGVGKDTSKNVALTLGTGFGSAFIGDGLPVVDGDTVPDNGCVWYIPFKDSISDDYFSTRWIVNRYKELTGEDTEGAKCVADKAKAGSKPALDVLNEYGLNMAQFMEPWFKKFNAKTIIIGGNISKAYDIFGKTFEEELKKHDININVKISILKEDAAIIGCCRLLEEEYFGRVKDILPKLA